jgi:hypothetical protein
MGSSSESEIEDDESDPKAVAKPAVMQVMQCMTKNFPKNV